MNIRYHEDTDSFFLTIGSGYYQHSIPVTDDFVVDLDWDHRIRAVESIGASRDLNISNIIANPPTFKWITLADDEPIPPRTNARIRHFIHRPTLDNVYMEFALGKPVATEPVFDGVYAEVNASGAVAGIQIENASENLDLDTILANGTPVIHWEPHPAPVATGIAAS